MIFTLLLIIVSLFFSPKLTESDKIFLKSILANREKW
jgi:hypothetical protein